MDGGAGDICGFSGYRGHLLRDDWRRFSNSLIVPASRNFRRKNGLLGYFQIPGQNLEMAVRFD